MKINLTIMTMVAATAALLPAAQAGASTTPPITPTITYPQSCARNTCEATVMESAGAYSGRATTAPRTFEFITTGQRRVRYTATETVWEWGGPPGWELQLPGWSRDPRGAEAYRVTIPPLFSHECYSVTITTVASRGQVPVITVHQGR